ncbi:MULTISPECIES: hypothetical protein [unclassified Bradyrhizobium]|uniref:hypothetical protein n=1 Tax=unclassified Bradyrhizobium TaxID=2631580 RepID=UPI00339256FD
MAIFGVVFLGFVLTRTDYSRAITLGIFTSVLARELDLERGCDAMFDRALDRLIELKAAERSITLEERSRFHRAKAPRARAK